MLSFLFCILSKSNYKFVQVVILATVDEFSLFFEGSELVGHGNYGVEWRWWVCWWVWVFCSANWVESHRRWEEFDGNDFCFREGRDDFSLKFEKQEKNYFSQWRRLWFEIWTRNVIKGLHAKNIYRSSACKLEFKWTKSAL